MATAVKSAGAREERVVRERQLEILKSGWRAFVPLIGVLLALTIWSVGFVDNTGVVFTMGFSVASVAWYAATFLARHAGTTHLLLGRDGERWTAEELRRLGGDWQVFHQLPLQYGNVDHVAIGPAGVFAFETKLRTDTWDLRRPDDWTRAAAKQALENARKVRLLLSSVHIGVRTSVTPVLVLWGDVVGDAAEVEGVTVIRGNDLERWCGALKESALEIELREQAQRGLAAVLEARLHWERSRRGDSTIIDVGPVEMLARIGAGLVGGTAALLIVAVTWPMVPTWSILLPPLAVAATSWRLQRVAWLRPYAFGALVASIALTVLGLGLHIWDALT